MGVVWIVILKNSHVRSLKFGFQSFDVVFRLFKRLTFSRVSGVKWPGLANFMIFDDLAWFWSVFIFIGYSNRFSGTQSPMKFTQMPENMNLWTQSAILGLKTTKNTDFRKIQIFEIWRFFGMKYPHWPQNLIFWKSWWILWVIIYSQTRFSSYLGILSLWNYIFQKTGSNDPVFPRGGGVIAKRLTLNVLKYS